MKTVFPFDTFPQYQNMIDASAGLVQFATGSGNMQLNRAICDGIVTTLEELVEMRPQSDALARGETAFILATKYLTALDNKLATLDPTAHMGDSLTSEIQSKAKAVSRIISYTLAETAANFAPGQDPLAQQYFNILRDTYVPELTRLQSSIDSANGGLALAVSMKPALALKR